MEPLHERTFNPLLQFATLLQFESQEYTLGRAKTHFINKFCAWNIYRRVTPFGQGLRLLAHLHVDVAGWSWHRVDTVCFTYHSSGPKGVSPGQKALLRGNQNLGFCDLIREMALVLGSWEYLPSRGGFWCIEAQGFWGHLFTQSSDDCSLTTTMRGYIFNHLAIILTTAVAGKAGFTLASAATAVDVFMTKWSNLYPPTVPELSVQPKL